MINWNTTKIFYILFVVSLIIFLVGVFSKNGMIIVLGFSDLLVLALVNDLVKK